MTTRAEVLQLVSDLSTTQADAVAIDRFYNDVVTDLGNEGWLQVVDLLPVTTNGAEFTPPDTTTIDVKYVFYDDRVMYCENLRALEVLNVNWRDERGTPAAYVREDESQHSWLLYPKPDRPSKDFVFMFGAPFGNDYPADAVAVVLAEFREVLPPWLAMPVALRICEFEFARESDHKDAKFSETCKALADMLFKMVGPDAD
jgi:hypothetical protein